MSKSPQFAPRYPPPSPDAIKAARDQAKLSMPQAAELCEVSAMSWEGWEAGKNRMPAPVWKLFNLLTKDQSDPSISKPDTLP